MNIPDHISESSETLFWVKIHKFFDADPGWKKFVSEINIPDPQHCFSLVLVTYIRRAVAQSSQLELQAADFVLLLPISLTLVAQLGAHSWHSGFALRGCILREREWVTKFFQPEMLLNLNFNFYFPYVWHGFSNKPFKICTADSKVKTCSEFCQKEAQFRSTDNLTRKYTNFFEKRKSQFPKWLTKK